MLTVTGEKLSSDFDATKPFVDKFEKTVRDLGLTSDQVYNADESGLFWRLLPKRVYVCRSEKSADGWKKAKDRITFMPCANASGTHKLQLLVIGKSKQPRAIRKVKVPVVYKGQSRAWMTKALFHEWFEEEFCPQVRRFLRSRNLPQKALLVVDNAPGHDTGEELTSKNGQIKVMFLPPNCTTLLQPMDQNIIENIKSKFKKKTLLHIVSRDGDISKTMKEMNLNDVVFTLAESWNEIQPEVIQASWKNLCPLFSTTDEDGESSSGTAGVWEPEDDIPLAGLIDVASARVHNENTEMQREDIEDWCAGVDDVDELVSLIRTTELLSTLF